MTNGKHELRLERIEKRLEEINEKMDVLVEQGVVNETDIRWLKWAVRGLLASAVGLSGAVYGGVL